ncbi:MAG: hypothetical protein LBK42_01725 [Propionibacteriaceae bacterium]|jgi:hypothetical protein|nr:hypothetical protein [Propionibacteriaceae bacterium]
MELLGPLPVFGVEPVLGLRDRLVDLLERGLDGPVLGQDDLEDAEARREVGDECDGQHIGSVGTSARWLPRKLLSAWVREWFTVVKCLLLSATL